MALDNRSTSTNRPPTKATTTAHTWTAPNVWATAPPKSPSQNQVSSFLGQEYTPTSSPPRRPRSLNLKTMNPFSSFNHNPPPPTLHQIDEEPRTTPYPTLNEVLHNASPPPYTLSSFMAYLSMMHSLETLEFLLDASRYRSIYQQTFVASNASGLGSSSSDAERVTTMWLRLIDAYVRPGGSREVNLPSELRDSLLIAPAQYAPPSPSLLDPPVTHIYNLMRDGVLPSFIASCNVHTPSSTPTTMKSDFPFSRSLWNRSSGGLLNRTASNSSSRSSYSDLSTAVSTTSATSQPISIPYPISPHRSSFPPSSSRSMCGFLSQSVANNLEDSHLESYLDQPSDELSDIDDASLGPHSSSGRISPMTPPLTPPPQGEGSPVEKGGMWSRRVRERFRLRKN